MQCTHYRLMSNQGGDVQSLMQTTTTVHTVTCVIIDQCETVFALMPNVCPSCALYCLSFG